MNLGKHLVYHDEIQHHAAYTSRKSDSATLLTFNSSHSTVRTLQILEHDNLIDYGAEFVASWIQTFTQPDEFLFSDILNSIYRSRYYFNYSKSTFSECEIVILGNNHYQVEDAELVAGERNTTEVNETSIVLIILIIISSISTLSIASFANFKLENYNLANPNNVAKAILSNFIKDTEGWNEEVTIQVTKKRRS